MVRASDAERYATADALRSHCAAGRLRVGELEARLSAALSASTVAELNELLADLPEQRAMHAPDQRGTTRKVRPGLPGLRRFRQDHELPMNCGHAFREALTDILPVMIGVGFDVISRVENELLVFERDDERVVMSFSDSESKTHVTVQGVARRALRRAFANHY